MAGKIDWEAQIGRRLKLRDLHVFLTVVQRGSMAKAAAFLGVSQPAVSEVIADLEHALRVPLLDRGPRGVECTRYGRALLKRSAAAFDELKQAIRDVEFLADPTAGEVRIGCVESIASTLLPPIFYRFSQKYPRVTLHVDRLITSDVELMALRERSLDAVLMRYSTPFTDEKHDLDIEALFDDQLVIVCGRQNRWAQRRKVDLAELVDEPWLLTPADNNTNNRILAEAFRVRGLPMPTGCLRTFSVELRTKLVAAGPYIAPFARSILQLNADRALKILPIELPTCTWPIVLVTVKNRTLNPVAQRFIDHIRAFTTAMKAGMEFKQMFA